MATPGVTQGWGHTHWAPGVQTAGAHCLPVDATATQAPFPLYRENLNGMPSGSMNTPDRCHLRKKPFLLSVGFGTEIHIFDLKMSHGVSILSDRRQIYRYILQYTTRGARTSGWCVNMQNECLRVISRSSMEQDHRLSVARSGLPVFRFSLYVCMHIARRK